MECYYKEMFGLGLFVALMIFVTILLFESVIEEWFVRIQKALKYGG